MADESMQRIWVGMYDEGQGKAEEGDIGMKKVACPLFLPFSLLIHRVIFSKRKVGTAPIKVIGRRTDGPHDYHPSLHQGLISIPG